jgi:hypothetical protein
MLAMSAAVATFAIGGGYRTAEAQAANQQHGVLSSETLENA